MTLIGLQSVIKAASYGDLARYIDVEAGGLMNVGDVLDEIGRSNGPTDFPASAVHHLASGEHSDCFLVVVANVGKEGVLATVEGKMIVDIV